MGCPSCWACRAERSAFWRPQCHRRAENFVEDDGIAQRVTVEVGDACLPGSCRRTGDARGVDRIDVALLNRSRRYC